ncbi:MAG: hypothetical protein A3K04_08155 [Gallionellales bacterium RBG_16_56_9]|nr:MAG: hypothetical protein A3K04_08155 [Gallionellales bacterium RBG_16_56_9]
MSTLGETIAAKLYANTRITQACTKTLLASPFTATVIRVFFDTEGLQTRAPGVMVENSMPTLKALTSSLAAAKAATYTIGGVVYKEAERRKLNPEETELDLTLDAP